MNYEVLIKAYCVVIVEAEDEEDALEISFNNSDVDFGDFEHDSSLVEREVPGCDLEQALRFASVKEVIRL